MHRPYSDGRELLGTIRYASVNAHRGIVHTRRDDLVSLCYVLIYFARGSLPWQERHTRLRKTAQQVARLKENTKPDRLCRGLPPALALLLHHATGLGFKERPDYDYCRTVLRQSMSDEDRERHDGEPRFDWEQSPEQWAGHV